MLTLKIMFCRCKNSSDDQQCSDYNHLWIGLKRNESYGGHDAITRRSGWNWEDGSSLSWANWFNGIENEQPQPDNYKCGCMKTDCGSWCSAECSGPFPFVCEKGK